MHLSCGVRVLLHLDLFNYSTLQSRCLFVLFLLLPEGLFNLRLDLLVLPPLVLLLLECLQLLVQPLHLLHCSLTLVPRLLVQLKGLH